MTTEILIEKVREELGTLDVPVEQAIAATIKIMQNVNAAPPPAEEKFSGRNITLEEYKALPREEKRRYHDEAEKLNWRWVENQLNRLNFQSGMFAIEELPTPWHTTKDIKDAYLAVSFIVSGSNNSIEIEADLDTGSADCYVSLACVDGWHESPFTSINSNRTFLLGRNVLWKLQPRLILDFAAKRTEVQFAEATS